jgi:ubiquinone/menaquinone biosynthesis C-methylase UbiE
VNRRRISRRVGEHLSGSSSVLQPVAHEKNYFLMLNFELLSRGIDPSSCLEVIFFMNIGRAVQKIYEKRPYPNLCRPARAKRYWVLPPLPWIKAIWQRQQRVRRILIAGCGTGNEAFAVRQKFPKAEILAVDFSSRSIRSATSLQRKNRGFRDIQFLVCDLTNPRLPGIVGDNFDLVSCHGVLSYIPKARKVLHNFARCLSPNGLLYLGLNGEAHFSRIWRQVLRDFGMNVTELQQTPSLRPLLKLFEVLSGCHSGEIADRNAGYLASALFGPLIHDWSLRQWVQLYRPAELHLLGSYSIFRPLRAAFQDELYRALMPRSRAQVVELFEKLKPSGFHRLILSRQPELRPPWKDLNKLRNWRPVLTQLYEWKWPRKTQGWATLRKVSLKSPSINTLVELPLLEWQVEVFRRSNGKNSIGDILQSLPVQTHPSPLRDHLYLLYQLAAMNLLPPAS